MKIACGRSGRNIVAAADLYCGSDLLKSKNDFRNQSAGYSVVAGKKGILLKEALATGAAVAPFPKMQKGRTTKGDILDNLLPIVVDTVSPGSTAGANVLSARQFQVYMKLI